MTDDNVTKLPIKFRKHPGDDEPMLKVVHSFANSCNHRSTYIDGKHHHATYLIREGETEVECSLCGTRLDPMWVLRILATEETVWTKYRERYQEEMKRLNERSRTKCQHCGEMTRISGS